MSGRRLQITILAAGALAAFAATAGRAQKPAAEPASKENIEAALKLTLAAAAAYEFRFGDDDKPPELRREPVLQWSNPDRGEVHGNVFVWTRDGRPVMVGSLFKWFTPHTHMSHEFHSLAEEPFSAKFHGEPVWKTSEAGLKFADLPDAGAPAAGEARLLAQMRQLARDFSGVKKERDDGNVVELRLLPQPIYRYAAPKQGVLAGGLFTLVHGTDPEIFVLIEARGKDAAGARWQYAPTRMTSSEVRLRHRDKEVFVGEIVPWKEIRSHEHAYTTFTFNEVPDFLKEALAKPKP
jgi:hypothetical protein